MDNVATYFPVKGAAVMPPCSPISSQNRHFIKLGIDKIMESLLDNDSIPLTVNQKSANLLRQLIVCEAPCWVI